MNWESVSISPDQDEGGMKVERPFKGQETAEGPHRADTWPRTAPGSPFPIELQELLSLSISVLIFSQLLFQTSQ